MSALGQSRPKSDVRATSDYRPITDMRRGAAQRRNGPDAELPRISEQKDSGLLSCKGAALPSR